MSAHNLTTRELITAGIATLVVGGVAAAVYGWSYVAPPTQSSQVAPAAGPSPAAIGPQPRPTSYVSNLGGTIASIASSSVTVSTISGKTGESPATTTVSVGSDTVTFKEVPKAAATFKAEQAAFLKESAASAATSTSTTSLTPPLPFTKQPLTLADLAPGMIVNISLAEKQDPNGMMHAISIGVLPVSE